MPTHAHKVAIVTGGSRGIGAAVAQRLAREGVSVVVNYAGDKDAADEVVAAIGSDGGDAVAIRANVADPEAVAAMFAQTTKAFGRIDIVVHNAGIMPLSPIADGDVDTFDRVIATNLRGAFVVLAESARQVVDGGRIIALSSSVVAKAFPRYGPYIASKAGVEGLVHVLANELRGRHVGVNAVAPGPVATKLFLDGKSRTETEKLAKAPPLERLGQPDDIADLIAFLAGPGGGWVNGQVSRANGGFA